MVCLVLSLPATWFAHPFPRHVHQCLAPIKSLLTSRSLGLPLPSLPATLFAHPFPRHVPSAWLLSSPCSPQDRLVCLSHLCLPPCLLTLSPDMFASDWLLSSPRSPQDHLVCFFPSAPATSFAHPPHTGFFYMAGWWGGRFMDGLGAH